MMIKLDSSRSISIYVRRFIYRFMRWMSVPILWMSNVTSSCWGTEHPPAFFSHKLEVIMSDPFVIIPKRIINHLVSYPYALALYSLILSNARYSDNPKEHAGTTINKGQWMRSQRQLCKDLATACGKGKTPLPRNTLRSAILVLERLGLVYQSSPLSPPSLPPSLPPTQTTIWEVVTPQDDSEKKAAKKQRKSKTTQLDAQLATTITTHSPPNTVIKREERVQEESLQKESSTTIDLHIAETFVSDTHTEGLDPKLVVKVRKDCQIFRCSDKEVDLLAAWYVKNKLPKDLLPEVALIVDDWLDGDTPAAKKARKAPTHYRHCRADWAIKKAQNIRKAASGNNGNGRWKGKWEQSMDRAKQIFAEMEAEESENFINVEGKVMQ
jgi:hypothetical protein